MSDQHDAKIGLIDIETSPLEAYTWGLWDQNVGLNQIKTEWTILSYSFKWLGSNKIIYEDTGGKGPGKVRDDKHLLLQIHKLLDEADIIVAQNGRRFDVKKINARMVMAGLKPYSPIRIVDTLEAAKKYFAFTSNKLEWASDYLTTQKKLDHREFPGFELWKECLADNPKAWIANHPNMGVYSEVVEHTCTKCASPNVQSRGKMRLQQGLYNRYCCQDCGSWSRGKLMLLPVAKRKAMLANIGDK